MFAFIVLVFVLRDVDVFATIWNLVQVVELFFGRAELVLAAEDDFDGDFAAHVLHVEILRVLFHRPPA